MDRPRLSGFDRRRVAIRAGRRAAHRVRDQTVHSVQPPHMLCPMATTTRQISLDVSADVLTAFDTMARRAGLSRPKMLATLVAEAEQKEAIEHDAAVLRRTGGDPDAELDAWVGIAGSRSFDVD